jgi:hypothetical protein
MKFKTKLSAQSLVAAARKGDLEKIRQCLGSGVDANAVITFVEGSVRTCALCGAAEKGQVEAIECLLTAGANPNNPLLQSTDSFPLDDAVYHGNVACAALLLKAGAKVNRVNREGETVLDTAKLFSNRPAVELLKKYGGKTGGELGTTAASRPRLWTSLAETAQVSEPTDHARQPHDHSSNLQLGITHFMQLVYDGQPEWSLFAIRAPIKVVSREFVAYRKAKLSIVNVALKSAGSEDEIAHFTTIVRVRDNPWTLVFRSLHWIDSSLLEAVPKEAKKLSARLKTRAVTFIAEDTSSTTAYEIVENGKSLEQAEWEGGNGFSSFKSTLRKKPTLDATGDEFADAVFRQQGIYLPACYPRSEGGKTWLAIQPASASVVECADLIEL